MPKVAYIILLDNLMYTDEFGARANKFQNWIICCHQKDFKLDKWISTRMTAIEVPRLVRRTPQNLMHLRQTTHFCSSCWRAFSADESVGLKKSGNKNSLKQTKFETNSVTNWQLSMLALCWTSAAGHTNANLWKSSELQRIRSAKPQDYME